MPKVSNHEKGRMLFEKLKSLSNSGELSLAKNREDLASLVGYAPSEVKTKGLSWVNRLIHKGIIAEKVLGFNEYSHRAENAYYLTGRELSYTWGGAHNTKTRLQNNTSDEEIVRLWEYNNKPEIKPIETVSQPAKKALSSSVKTQPASVIPKMSIFKNDVVITFENIDIATAKEMLDFWA